MAKKVNLMKLLQEVRGYDRVTNRRPAPPAPLLYLMQLRQRNAHAQLPLQQTAPRLAITTKWPVPGEPALPVRITHTPVSEGELPVVIG